MADTPSSSTSSNSKVLLVDDEPGLRESVQAYLEDSDFDVRVASNAAEGWDLLQQEAPNVLISDIMMPQVDGYQFLKQVREDVRFKSLPVVFLTARGMTSDRIQGYNAGADAYLAKPFDPEELLAIVDGCIAHRDNLNGDAVQARDLQRDLDEIKFLLLQQGGAGPGVNGFVSRTDVFLAPDEREALQLLCEGLKTKEIADRMFLSKRRVEQLLTRMFRKTECKNRTDLVRWAISTEMATILIS